MTTYLTSILLRTMTTQSEMKDSMRRRTSGFRYWLLVPFVGVLIYASIIWSLGGLLVLGRLADRIRLRR